MMHQSRVLLDSFDRESEIVRGSQLDTAKRNTLFNTTPEGFSMVVERLGKFHRVQEAGLFLAVPLVDRIVAVHDKRELCLQVSKQQATTGDGVRLSLEGNVYVRVVDVYKATYNVRDPLHAILKLAEGAMRASVSLFELDNIVEARAALNKAVLEHLQEACANWGLEVMAVDADVRISESMDRMVSAEQRRRETVKSAEAEKEAIILESEAFREREVNESEGQRIRAITEARGFSEQQVLRAEGLKKAKMLEAEATAFAIETIGKAAKSPEGERAMRYVFGVEYTKYMSELGSKSNSTIFLGNDLSDLSATLAKGVGLLSTDAFKKEAEAFRETKESAATVSDTREDDYDIGYARKYDSLSYSMNAPSSSTTATSSGSGGDYSKEIDELNSELSQFGSISDRRTKD